ncbi:hypothetical protein [[Mycoplasma] collis]|uniref:hypothetical protein n=1 Tax=[Mycoplasma] collis TaxID=2127 RepID=UPI00069009A8|nr:hypothetical protein [[Mycoplasma] collis]
MNNKPRQRLHLYYKKGGKRSKNFVQRLVKAKYVKSIWARLKIIDSREGIGHWELDLVIGKKDKNSDNLLTFVERVLRFSIIIKVSSKKPHYINKILKPYLVLFGPTIFEIKLLFSL